MSRLDSFIRRLEAQRAGLDLAAHAINDLQGSVLELGLGNGRTYAHLRARLPEREIIVFERGVRAHPDCIPDSEYLMLGAIEETLPAFAESRAGQAALVHSDIGTGDAARNRKLAAWLAEALPPLLRPGAWVVADQALQETSLARQPLPADVAVDRYFLYRHEPT
ncbi:MAG: class I SAM-dependent methyltransferase [Geminicoccaceae bacterium]